MKKKKNCDLIKYYIINIWTTTVLYLLAKIAVADTHSSVIVLCRMQIITKMLGLKCSYFKIGPLPIYISILIHFYILYICISILILITWCRVDEQTTNDLEERAKFPGALANSTWSKNISQVHWIKWEKKSNSFYSVMNIIWLTGKLIAIQIYVISTFILYSAEQVTDFYDIKNQGFHIPVDVKEYK